MYEKTLKSERAFSGRLVNVRVDSVELEDGHISSREIVEHRGGVAVLPVTDEREVILVRQYRYAYECELLEAPAGKLEAGEAPLDCGMRELGEETGFTAREYISCGCVYPSPGYLNEKLYLFLARGLTPGEIHLDEDEFLRAERYALTDALEMVYSGKIRDAKTIILLLRAKELM